MYAFRVKTKYRITLIEEYLSNSAKLLPADIFVLHAVFKHVPFWTLDTLYGAQKLCSVVHAWTDGNGLANESMSVLLSF